MMHTKRLCPGSFLVDFQNIKDGDQHPWMVFLVSQNLPSQPPESSLFFMVGSKVTQVSASVFC